MKKKQLLDYFIQNTPINHPTLFYPFPFSFHKMINHPNFITELMQACNSQLLDPLNLYHLAQMTK